MRHKPMTAIFSKRIPTWRRRLYLVLVLIAAPVLVHFTWFVVEGFTDELTPSDVAIVLGNTVHPDGKPSARLAGRLDRALDLYQAKIVPNIIVSGGLGVEGHDEAVVMRQYLIEKGVPADRVIADSFGVNTAATALNSARIMGERGWKSATAVSQYFHIARCKMTFSRAGITPVYGAHAKYFELRDFPSLVRDYGGYWVYLVRGKGRRADDVQA